MNENILNNPGLIIFTKATALILLGERKNTVREREGGASKEKE